MEIGIILFWLALAGVVAAVVFGGKGRALPESTETADPALPPKSSTSEADASDDSGTDEEGDPKSAPAETVDPHSRLSAGLAKTRGGFIARLDRLVRGRPKVDDDLMDEIEEVLFTADIGPKAAEKLREAVVQRLDRREIAEPSLVWAAIREASLEILEQPGATTHYDVDPLPYVLLMIGVNGVGKTTTLAKLAARHVTEGRKVLMVAGDTFRAAAAEQLAVWAERIGCDLHVGRDGADPSSVIFDGVSRGRREGYDVVLCDTAGRLQGRKELMDELAKIRRSAEKALSKDRSSDVGLHDIYLVLDATIGQNALKQAEVFRETVDFTGLVITKLDGTAKGGVVLGVCDEMGVPVRFIGIGEAVDDLREFDPRAFADALFDAGSGAGASGLTDAKPDAKTGESGESRSQVAG